MQKVQDRLDFKIETPDDEEVKRRYAKEETEKLFISFDECEPVPTLCLTKNQRKRRRKKNNKRAEKSRRKIRNSRGVTG